jgi:potassium-transporting ATPase ATP-binding subunit
VILAGCPSADGLAADAEVIPFKAETRMSGVRQDGHAYFKGAADAIVAAASVDGQRPPELDGQVERISRAADGGTTSAADSQPSRDLTTEVERISREGGTPLAMMMDNRIVGVIYLKDTVKPGMRQRFDEFRRMGIKTIMITGDNPLTAATIAQEAGVDDFVAQAKPATCSFTVCFPATKRTLFRREASRRLSPTPRPVYLHQSEVLTIAL